MVFCFVLFLLGLYFILFYNVHYTMLLLSMELLLLGVFVFICLDTFSSLGFVGVFLFLLVMVCMGGFSISLLVSLARGFGRDYWFSGSIF